MTDTKKVLFFSLYSIPPVWTFHNQVDATVATALIQRGCEVKVVGCDGIFQDCYILRDTKNHSQEFCNYCSQSSQKYFCDLFKLPYQQLRDFVDDKDYLIAEQWVKTLNPKQYPMAVYQDIPIGSWVISSIYTYFRISARSLSRPDVIKTHRNYLVDALVTYKAVSRLLDFYQPTILFMFSARLAPYRIAFETARQRGIDVIVQERGYIDNSYTLVENHTCLNTKPKFDLTKAWENIPLNKSELLQVKKYWYERESGRNLNISSFYDYKTDYSQVRTQLNIPQNAKIVTVFTSSEDELAAFEDYGGVIKQIEVIDKLIQIFTKRDEYLVIRHHPYIAGKKFVQAETDFIVRAYQQSLSAPPNVRIIMPSEQLTSYALLWNADASIVFFSTMAIEATARGIPTAVTEASVYSQALRYTINKFDSASLETIIEQLESAQSNLEDMRKLYRFAHAYFFKFCQTFHSFDSQGLKFTKKDELKPGIDPTLDKVCNRILHGSSLYNLPQTEDYQRSLEDENDFLEQYLLEVNQYRQQVRDSAEKVNLTVAYPPVGIINLSDPTEQQSNTFLSAYTQRSIYQPINIYQVDYTGWENHKKGIDSILNFLQSLEEEYIVLTNNYIQYNESCISSAMHFLLSDQQKELQGVRFGGWLPVQSTRVHNKVFPDQDIFTYKNPALIYEKAITILPWLKYSPALLAFSLLRKSALMKILTMSRQLSTANEAAELLFMFLQSAAIHRVDKPMLLIHGIPKAIQKDYQHEQLIILKEFLNLREINLIIFPDWYRNEELILLQLQRVFQSLLTHPERHRITLLIDTTSISLDEANLYLSSVTMNLLMQEDLEVSEDVEISLIDELNEIQWQALLPQIQARIALDQENQNAIAQAKAEQIPSLKLPV
jgi:hypothetical protein